MAPAEIAATLDAVDRRIRIMTHSQNAGIAAARNRGLGAIATSSAYVAFLDHDDVWIPEAIETLLKRVSQSSDGQRRTRHRHRYRQPRQTTFLSTGTRAAANGVIGRHLMEWPTTRPTEFANLAYEDCIVSMGSGLIRSRDLAALGGFDLRAEPADDYDLWIRLARRSEIGFVDRAVLAYRSHEGQTSLRPPRPADEARRT